MARGDYSAMVKAGLDFCHVATSPTPTTATLLVHTLSASTPNVAGLRYYLLPLQLLSSPDIAARLNRSEFERELEAGPIWISTVISAAANLVPGVLDRLRVQIPWPAATSAITALSDAAKQLSVRLDPAIVTFCRSPIMVTLSDADKAPIEVLLEELVAARAAWEWSDSLKLRWTRFEGLYRQTAPPVRAGGGRWILRDVLRPLG
jgi:hypothetical protein